MSNIFTNVHVTGDSKRLFNPEKKTIHIVGKKDGKVKNEVIIEKKALYSIGGVLLLMTAGAITYAALKN